MEPQILQQRELLIRATPNIKQEVFDKAIFTFKDSEVKVP